MRRKLFAGLLIIAMLALAACGKDKDKTEASATPVVVVSDQAGDLEVQEAINNAAGTTGFSVTEQPLTLQGTQEEAQAEPAQEAPAEEAPAAEAAADTEPEPAAEEPQAVPEDGSAAAGDAGEGSGEAAIDAERMDLYAKTADYLVTMQFGDNHRTVAEGNTLQVAVWKENVALAAAEAQAGNEELRAAWFDMGENMAGLSRSLYDAMANFDLEGGPVILYLLNDQNPENVLLTFVDGEKIYDVVQ